MNNFAPVPAATYRLQFNQKFRFADARALVPYLEALGITDLYASPLLAARPGSPHGYDITDPARLNPELGSEEEFAALAAELRRRGMGLLLDIVPNHMAASSENPWWADVLENGPQSPFASFFDLDWNPEGVPGLAGQVLVPVLATLYGDALENGELTVTLAEDGFWLCYRGLRFPLNRASAVRILERGLKKLVPDPARPRPAAAQLLAVIAALKKPPGQAGGEEESPEEGRTDGAKGAKGGGAGGGAGKAAGEGKGGGGRRAVWEKLWRLYSGEPEIKAFLDENLRAVNGRKKDPARFNLLDRIIREQFYRPAFWRAAREEINYRRFFDVSDLVSLRMEDKKVFAATHALILRLAGAGLVTGLRIDHLDGLADPQAYLERLQESLREAGAPAAEGAGANAAPGRPYFYVVAEKILSEGEELPAGWPVYGTTGYDFLNRLNGLFVDGQGAADLDELYARLGGPETDRDFARVVYRQKKKVMAELFAGETNNLARALARLAVADRHGRDFTLSELKEALTEITACLPVYRTYTRSYTLAEQDRRHLARAVQEAVRRRPAARPACAFLHRVLRLEFPDYLTPGQKAQWLRFVIRWQQFTGPVMAKGFEDTALYIYNRLVSLNEVGGDPSRTGGLSPAEFHRRNQARLLTSPHTLNATSTHDTKRSEDVRARINVLSEIAAAWRERAEQWHRWNRPLKPVLKGAPVPDPATELLIYQTLLGAWPLRPEEVPSFRERLRAYLIKAVREAKTRTSWLVPNPAYEHALEKFLAALLEPSPENRFLPDFLEFQKVTAFYGAVNSLAQVLLKIASPGVPDFYQGTELWNFSLVDPDNRWPVDFRTRAEMLAALQKAEEEEEKQKRKGKGTAAGAGNDAEIGAGAGKGPDAGAGTGAGAAGVGGEPPLARKLLDTWEDGRVKLYLTYKALRFRRSRRELFAAGEYLPLEAAGPRAGYVCAFARRRESAWALAAAPRLAARLAKENSGAPLLPPLAFPLGEAAWGETCLLLPASAPARWRNLLTGETVQAATLPPSSAGDPPRPEQQVPALPLAAVFRNFPVALLAPEENSR